MIFGPEKIIYLPACQSTNDIAAELIANGQAAEGLVVITDNQTAGRGQRGNKWEATPSQNLTATFILSPVWLSINNQFLLSVITSLALADTVMHFTQREVKIKWPNDIYFINQKLAGILIENSLRGSKWQWSMVGIGLNINQTNFVNLNATSLSLVRNRQFSVTEKEMILYFLYNKIFHYYHLLKSGAGERLLAIYNNLLYRFGQKASYALPDGNLFTGKIISVKQNGLLQMEIYPENESDLPNISEFGFKEVIFVP